MKSHSAIQSVLIKRKSKTNNERDIDRAIKKVNRLGFKVKKVDITPTYFRFRQFTPKSNDRFITKKIGDDRLIVKVN